MKKLLVIATLLAGVLYAQRQAPQHGREQQPRMEQRMPEQHMERAIPQPMRGPEPDRGRIEHPRPMPPQPPRWSPPPRVVVVPRVDGYRYYDPFFYGNPFYSPFWGSWGYYSGSVWIETPNPCKKEKLKDSAGKKHEILVCKQPDGSYKIVADADNLHN